jgi:hypothetical protein
MKNSANRFCDYHAVAARLQVDRNGLPWRQRNLLQAREIVRPYTTEMLEEDVNSAGRR